MSNQGYLTTKSSGIPVKLQVVKKRTFKSWTDRHFAHQFDGVFCLWHWQLQGTSFASHFVPWRYCWYVSRISTHTIFASSFIVCWRIWFTYLCMARVMKVNLTEFWTIRRAFQQAALIGFILGKIINKKLDTVVTPKTHNYCIICPKNVLINPNKGTFCMPPLFISVC